MISKKYQVFSPSEIVACKTSTCEQEVTFSSYRGDNTIEVYASDNTWITKLKRAWAKNVDNWKCFATKDKEGNVVGYFFEMPKNALSIKSGVKKKVNFSEEHRAKIAEALKKRR